MKEKMVDLVQWLSIDFVQEEVDPGLGSIAMTLVLRSSWSRKELIAEKALDLKRIGIDCGEESLNYFSNARAATESVRAATGSGGAASLSKFADFQGSAILGDPRVFSHQDKDFNFRLRRGQSFPGLEGPGESTIQNSITTQFFLVQEEVNWPKMKNGLPKPSLVQMF